MLAINTKQYHVIGEQKDRTARVINGRAIGTCNDIEREKMMSSCWMLQVERQHVTPGQAYQQFNDARRL